MNHLAFTPYSATAGGVLIALGLGGMLLGSGRLAGITGVVAGLLRPVPGDRLWRALFVGGMVLGGLLAFVLLPGAFDAHPARSPLLLGAAGLLVGVGTRLANGCTSGHGICGNARLARRSIVATLTFMATGSIAAIAAAHLGWRS